MNNLSVPNKYHALLIGVDDYPSQPLYSCVNDVCRIKNFLEIKKSGQVNIMTLTATKGAPLGDSEQRPTYTNIDSALKTIETQAKAGDFAYVHFSGHGTTEKTQYKHSNKLTGDLALCILNKDGKEVCLKGTVFANGLNKLVEKGIIVTVVLDCCFSASVYRSGDHDIRYLPYDRTITSPRQIQPDSSFMGQNPGSTHRDGSMRDNWLIDPDGYTIFAACGPDEIAKGGSERMENGKRYGALSCFIFNALSKHGLGWRNKDLYRYLCARFREDEQGDKPQNPVLFGNGDQGFFGPVNLHSGERLIGVVQGGANFQLMAGKAHGLREDDRFSISPLGLKGVEGGCTAKITQAGAFTSSLELLDATPRDIQTGWVAQPRTSSYLASFRVYLSHDLPQRAQLLAALGKHSLGTVTEPHSHSVFKVIANNEEYEILDESGQIIINLPIMTDIRGITEVLEHLVWFKMTKDLTNIEPKTSFGKSFDIWIMGDRRYRHGEQIEVEHDGYISVFMKNKGNTDLYVHVYNLSPRWGISNILSKGYEVVPNQNDEHKIREIHMTIPLMMQEHGSCEDIIKVFVTTHPTSFELLELPNLNEQAKQEKRTQNRGTPPNNPIPKDWTAFNFYIHTSGKQTAQDSSKSRGGFRDGLGNGNSVSQSANSLIRTRYLTSDLRLGAK
ncbi:putative caspase [Hypoxylon crocopeplum]|nr:putative caspase [Hypoxylon crocopeplum]